MGTLIVGIIVGIIIILSVSSYIKQRKKGCCGSCSACKGCVKANEKDKK